MMNEKVHFLRYITFVSYFLQKFIFNYILLILIKYSFLSKNRNPVSFSNNLMRINKNIPFAQPYLHNKLV